MHVGPQAVSGAAVLQFLLTSFAGGVRPVVREIVPPQALVLAACRLRRGRKKQPKEQERVDAGNKQGKEDSWDSCEVAALPGLSRLAAWFESIQCLRKEKAMRR